MSLSDDIPVFTQQMKYSKQREHINRLADGINSRQMHNKFFCKHEASP
jgi:hypothetical protein